MTGDVFMSDERVRASRASIDRVVRIIIGLFVLSMVFVGPRTPLGWFGLMPLMTGLLGGCPGSACSAAGACATRPTEGDSES